MNVKGCGVATEAAAVVLTLPEAKRNGALPSLATYLAFEALVVDLLPFFFLRVDSEDPGLLERARQFAIAGRLLVARVRWLDEMMDSGRPLGTPEEVHRLSAATHAEAVSRFSSGLDGAKDAANFFRILTALEARYAASLAIDASSAGRPEAGRRPARVELRPYAEQAKARAMLASASVEALLMVTGAGEEDKSRARRCLEAIAVAWQLYDDVLDLEEDYRDGRLSWIVSETLSGLPEDDPPLEPDEFYETALLGGHVRHALKESLAFYREAEQAVRDLFPGIVDFINYEIGRTTSMLADLTALVPSARG